jgi:hypothetical protein
LLTTIPVAVKVTGIEVLPRTIPEADFLDSVATMYSFMGEPKAAEAIQISIPIPVAPYLRLNLRMTDHEPENARLHSNAQEFGSVQYQEIR